MVCVQYYIQERVGHYDQLSFARKTSLSILNNERINADFGTISLYLLLYYIFDGKIGYDPKTLRYIMGHSDISVTMNVYTHIRFNDAEEEPKRMEEFRKTHAAIEKKKNQCHRRCLCNLIMEE